MTLSSRSLLALLLSLVLVLTAQTMAMARGAPGPAGQMELCTGSGVVIVTLDENGDPVGRPHICPDYALHLLSAVVPPDAPVLRLPVRPDPRPDRVARTSPAPVRLLPGARAPPVPV